jgi:hypothetical protein
MKHTSRILFAAAVMVALPIMLASAQPSASATTIPASGGKAAEKWNANPIGVYDITLNTADRAVPARITISNTGDKLLALFWPKGDLKGEKMEVTVAATDLVLTARTARGPMEVSIERRGQRLSGSWILGSQHGSLTGEVAP